jgi:glutathione synthase/RimK-type ligase-like ATP-grasp enzyme
MQVLIIGSKKTKSVSRQIEAFSAAGFSKADFLNIYKLNLVSKGGKTDVVDGGLKVSDYDAVYIRADLKLSPFVEPLLDELRDRGIFTQLKPGAFYLNSNEALQIAALNGRKLPVAKSVLVVDPKRIRDSAEKFRYPLIFKSFVSQTKTQSILIESPRSLKSITKSIKMDLDCAILKEFEEADLIQCAVIGNKVFAIRRRWNGSEIQRLENGRAYLISDREKVIAMRAALACNCEIATVKLSNGLVTEVVPDINFPVFRQKIEEDLPKMIALHFKSRISGKKLKLRKLAPSFFDRAKKFLEGVFNA